MQLSEIGQPKKKKWKKKFWATGYITDHKRKHIGQVLTKKN